MEAIGLFLNIPVQKKVLNERQELIQRIQCAINVERMGTKYPPITGRAVAMKVSHIKTKDLYFLDSICRDARNRGKKYGFVFFGSLKVKNA
jgi:hypothetical protein